MQRLLPEKSQKIYILRKGLDTVESLSVEVKGPKASNFTVSEAFSSILLSTLSSSIVAGTKSRAFVYSVLIQGGLG